MRQLQPTTSTGFSLSKKKTLVDGAPGSSRSIQLQVTSPTPGHLVSATTLRSFCNLGMASLELTVGLGPQILKNSKKMSITSWHVTGIMMDWDKLVVPGLVNIQT
jgi:hypothetical protein